MTQEAIDAGAVISKPQRGEMSDENYNEFIRISGQMMKQAMTERIGDPGWRRLSPDERRDAFDVEKKAGRKAARALLAGTAPASDD